MYWLLFLVGFATAGDISARSSRTFGSLFGHSAQAKQQQQQAPRQEEIKPLVYSVKYYDNIDKVGVSGGGVVGVDREVPVQPYPYVYVPYNGMGMGVTAVQVVPCPVEYYYTTVIDKQRQPVPGRQQPQMVPGVVQPVQQQERPGAYTNKPVPTQRIPMGQGGQVPGQREVPMGQYGQYGQYVGVSVPMQVPQVGYVNQGVPQVNPVGMGMVPGGVGVGVVPMGQSVGVGVVPVQQSMVPHSHPQQGPGGMGVVGMGHSMMPPMGQVYDYNPYPYYYPYYYNPVVAEAASSPYVYVYNSKPHHHHHPQQQQQQQQVQQQQQQQRVDNKEEDKTKKEQA